MKKLFLLLVLFFVAPLKDIYSQVYYTEGLTQDSWGIGFGLNYPRLVSTVLEATNSNYGGFLSIQRNFSEHTAFRFEASYNHFEGEYKNALPRVTKTDLFSGDFDLLYYFVPCESVSPYLLFGIGGIVYKASNAASPVLDDSLIIGYKFNLGLGIEWKISSDWRIKSEMSYFSVDGSKIDGMDWTRLDPGTSLLGGSNDSYASVDIGFVYYFDKGEQSRLCDLYYGLEPKVDYDRIEEIVKSYSVEPQEFDYARIEDIVKKYSVRKEKSPDRWVLIGVNFDLNKATLRPESYPVLYNAAEVLLLNPDVNVEIQGHTDNTGSEAYNKKLSLLRAETVKNFLVAKGVDASRLSVVGFGESKPISDNKTEQGRELNRRIEFLVK
ncbi:MAG: OmpA family protein [Ignavibacteriaceae bacterium]|nr:OmpA family protein [Ignavibacteriaceae bacterium]